MNNHSHIRYAEHCAEMAAEAETKKEEAHWWSEYRRAMICATGDKGLFRKTPSSTNRPSRALIKTMLTCSCGVKQFRWSRSRKQYEMFCGHDTSYTSTLSGSGNERYEERTCRCGVKSPKQRTGAIVKFSCACGIETSWHFSNKEARDEWNILQKTKTGTSDNITQECLKL